MTDYRKEKQPQNSVALNAIYVGDHKEIRKEKEIGN